jgi:hypothetical protein
MVTTMSSTARNPSSPALGSLTSTLSCVVPGAQVPKAFPASLFPKTLLASALVAMSARWGESFPSSLPAPHSTLLRCAVSWKVQPTRQVIFENVRVPITNRLGAEGQGFHMAMAGLDGGRLNIAACSLGAAQTAMDIALKYIKERKQFGKAIGDYQATQVISSSIPPHHTRMALTVHSVSCLLLLLLLCCSVLLSLLVPCGRDGNEHQHDAPQPTVPFSLLSSASFTVLLRSAAHLLDTGHPAAGIHCAMAKKMVTDIGQHSPPLLSPHLPQDSMSSTKLCSSTVDTDTSRSSPPLSLSRSLLTTLPPPLP